MMETSTVKHVWNGQSKVDKTNILKQVESIAECFIWSFLQYFTTALSDDWSWKLIGHFESAGFTVLKATSKWSIQVI